MWSRLLTISATLTSVAKYATYLTSRPRGRFIGVPPRLRRSPLRCPQRGRVLATAHDAASGGRAPRRARLGAARRRSFDDQVGAHEELAWNGDPETPGRLEIDRQVECRWLFDRQVCGLGSAENLVDVDGGLGEGRADVRAIRKQPTQLYIFTRGKNRGKTCSRDRFYDFGSESRVRPKLRQQNSISAQLRNGRKRSIQIICAPEFDNGDVDATQRRLPKHHRRKAERGVHEYRHSSNAR